MRDEKDAIEESGGTLVFVGTGRPHAAKAFREDMNLDSPVYSDPHMKAYRRAGLRRGVTSTFNPKSVAHGARATFKGFRQTRTKGDPWQQGGVFVIGENGKPAWEYVSREAGDHPKTADILEALDRLTPTV